MNSIETPLGGTPATETPIHVPNRIIVVEQVSWLPGESGQGIPVESRFCRWLETDLDPCGPRNFKALPEWKPIDLGWLKGEKVSFLHFANTEGAASFVNRTKDEKGQLSKMVLEIALSETALDTPLVLRPGSGIRIEVNNPALIRVRCAAGACKYALTVFPY